MPYIKRHTAADGRRNREHDDMKRKERQRIYHSALWRRMSEAYLAHHPLCEQCLQKGILRPAVDVHHRVSFTQFTGQKLLEVAYNPRNLMALCKECHANIHLHNRKH